MQEGRNRVKRPPVQCSIKWNVPSGKNDPIANRRRRPVFAVQATHSQWLVMRPVEGRFGGFLPIQEQANTEIGGCRQNTVFGYRRVKKISFISNPPRERGSIRPGAQAFPAFPANGRRRVEQPEADAAAIPFLGISAWAQEHRGRTAPPGRDRRAGRISRNGQTLGGYPRRSFLKLTPMRQQSPSGSGLSPQYLRLFMSNRRGRILAKSGLPSVRAPSWA